MNTGQPQAAQILNIDIPFDGLGLISIPASETISPVYTMWVTLVAMYTGIPCFSGLSNACLPCNSFNAPSTARAYRAAHLQGSNHQACQICVTESMTTGKTFVLL